MTMKGEIIVIKIDEISKNFGNVKALDKLSFNIQTGSVFGLVGSNGSGKSTLLRILSGVYTADDGVIMIDDNDIYDNEKVKNLTFFVSDFPYFSDTDNLKSLSKLYRSMYTNWSDEKYETLCYMFPINQKAKIVNMSKGMQRQVALILALSTRPKYLFLDEIFDGLDPVIRQLVKKLIIQDITENDMTVIIASHNLRELEDICDHIGFLHKGGILLESDISELKLGIVKVQAVFKQDINKDDFKNCDIIKFDSTGKMFQLVFRGKQEDVVKSIESLNPIFYEVLPLTLEEIFISEMEVAGYDIDSIIK